MHAALRELTFQIPGALVGIGCRVIHTSWTSILQQEMKMKNSGRLTCAAFVLGCALLAAGCISIDQEIFLNADGSGDVAIVISLIDLKLLLLV